MVVSKKILPEFNECTQKCPKFYKEEEKECEDQCEKIYDKYPYMLYDRYKDDEEKLYQEVKDSQIFTTRKRKDRDNFWFRMFG